SAMAEILVSDFCERMFRRKPAPWPDPGWTPVRRQEHAPINSPGLESRPTGRMHAPGCPTVPTALRIVFSVVFFIVFPLFLRRQLFSSPRKDLACNSRAFSLVNRLYFSKKISSPSGE